MVGLSYLKKKELEDFVGSTEKFYQYGWDNARQVQVTTDQNCYFKKLDKLMIVLFKTYKVQNEIIQLLVQLYKQKSVQLSNKNSKKKCREATTLTVCTS
jgi:hypothetical protein